MDDILQISGAALTLIGVTVLRVCVNPKHKSSATRRRRRNGNTDYAGLRGEMNIIRSINELGTSCLHDVILEDDRGLTQIDHLIRMPWGIAVVETKNFRGVIVGKPHDQYWTQVITSDSKKTTNSFYNPIKQNTRHELAVRHVVADEAVVIRGFVVFTGDVLIGDALRGIVCIDNTIIHSVSNYSAPMLNSGSLDSA